MWRAVKFSLTIIAAKGVAFIFQYNYFLCVIFDYLVDSVLCNIAQIATNLRVIFKIYIAFLW